MSIDITTLRNLPVGDKLRVVTALWDEIANSECPVEIPSDVLEEATRRRDELKADSSIAIDDEELWRRVDA